MGSMIVHILMTFIQLFYLNANANYVNEYYAAFLQSFILAIYQNCFYLSIFVNCFNFGRSQ